VAVKLYSQLHVLFKAEHLRRKSPKTLYAVNFCIKMRHNCEATSVSLLWLRRLLTCLSPRSSKFDLVPVYVGIEEDEAVIGQISFQVLRNPPITVIPPGLLIHSSITDDKISQQLTTPLEEILLSFRRVKLKSNSIELTPGARADAHLEWHYGVRIPNNRPLDFYTMQYIRFSLSFQRNLLPPDSG